MFKETCIQKKLCLIYFCLLSVLYCLCQPIRSHFHFRNGALLVEPREICLHEFCYIVPTMDSGLLDGGLISALLYPESGFWTPRWRTAIFRWRTDGGPVIPTVDSGLLGGGLLYPDSGFWIPRWRTTISRQWILDSSMEDCYRRNRAREFCCL